MYVYTRVWHGLSTTGAHLCQEEVLPNVAVIADNARVGLDHLQDPLPHGIKVWVYLSCEGNSCLTLCVLNRVLLHFSVHLHALKEHTCTLALHGVNIYLHRHWLKLADSTELPGTTHKGVWQTVQDGSVFTHIHKQHCGEGQAAASECNRAATYSARQHRQPALQTGAMEGVCVRGRVLV